MDEQSDGLLFACNCGLPLSDHVSSAVDGQVMNLEVQEVGHPVLNECAWHSASSDDNLGGCLRDQILQALNASLETLSP